MKFRAKGLGVILCFAVLGVGCRVHAEVGYSMRGDARPFHQWDSAFNLSAADSTDNSDGIVWEGDKFKIRPHISVWGGYDDNVYLRHSEEVDDTYWSVAPGIMLVYGQQDDDYLTLNYEYEMTKYTDEDVLDYDSHLFSAGMRLTPGHFDIHISDQFLDSVDVNRETAERVARKQNTESLYVSRYISRKTSLMGDQRYELYDYTDDAYLDYSELWFGGRAYHRTLPKVRTFVGGGYGIVNMTDAGVWGDADYIEVDVGLEGNATAKTTVYTSLGWQNREFKDDIDSINEWTFLAGVSSRLSNRTYWGLDISRGLQPSSTREGYTRVPFSIMPSVRHVMWKHKLSFSLSGAYEIADYYGHHGEEPWSDEYWYVTGMIDWHPHDLLTVGVGVTHTELNSDYDDDDYQQNQVYARAMANY